MAGPAPKSMPVRTRGQPHTAIAPDVGHDDPHWPRVLGAPVEDAFALAGHQALKIVFVQLVNGYQLIVLQILTHGCAPRSKAAQPA